MQRYDVNQIDLFAAYVIPVDAWYLIPATLIVAADRISDAMLCPIEPPVKKKSYRYEYYREAWNLLTKSRSELAQVSDIGPAPGTKLRKYLPENLESDAVKLTRKMTSSSGR